MKGTSQDATALALRQKGKGDKDKKKDKKDLVCSYCKRKYYNKSIYWIKNLSLKGKTRDKGKESSKDNSSNEKVLKLAMLIQRIAFIR